MNVATCCEPRTARAPSADQPQFCGSKTTATQSFRLSLGFWLAQFIAPLHDGSAWSEDPGCTRSFRSCILCVRGTLHHAASSSTHSKVPTKTRGIGKPPLSLNSARQSAPAGNGHPFYIVPASQSKIREMSWFPKFCELCEMHSLKLVGRAIGGFFTSFFELAKSHSNA